MPDVDWSSPFVSVIAGLVVSLVVATVFHVLAGRELKRSMDKVAQHLEDTATNSAGYMDAKVADLERLIDILAKRVEDPQRTSIRRDETGRIVGNDFDETHLDDAGATDKFTFKVITGDDERVEVRSDRGESGVEHTE